MKTAIFPGSFNPFTIGHLDILSQAVKLFDKIIIVYAINPEKEQQIDNDELLKIVTYQFDTLPNLFKDSGCIIECIQSNKCTIDVYKEYNAEYIIRGIRNTVDFEYEKNLFKANKELDITINTVYFMSKFNTDHISSTFVRELMKYKKPYQKYIIL